MRVPFLDLKEQYHSIHSEIAQAITRVLDSGQYILGPEVSAFEEAFARTHNAPHGIAVNNGTSAVHLPLWALGLQRGDEVIVPVNTFIATAEAVVLTGATPVFVDHDEYYNLDVEQTAARIRRRTKALLPVHLYGQPARMDKLAALAERHDLWLVEDAAQAHLATFDGKSIGSWGDATAFSFYPGKNLGAYGEGGAVITHNAELNRRMRLLRDHGSETKYQHVMAGHNYRMEALQAAILNVKLQHLAQWTNLRRAHAARYSELLADCEPIQLPLEHPLSDPVYHLFVIQADRRDNLRDHLEANGIGAGLHYPVPLHMQPAFAQLGYKEGAFPKAEHAAKRILSLPMYPEMRDEQIEFVAKTIRTFYTNGRKSK
ncbi:MAG: DegT/DnrJ/EryC1/StrS family aminotransferase [Bacteroidota bacterium]|nr:DegT/DnrJ/EryC1/StrS family aminotransferase [Bacteroidota bacterium]MDP4232704.1 DegT/DnrJ/EryC1/StrS family aminotransferase [Bacteroidota bacterium]MDP4243163.1 DegT/DnrJ/EryC1/StrS family aminotransferase [Bacteroidota bacterium]MDP4287620.1 DegT/DnrJ/EryC1/StrS family aminotransferase [Bacteroidota bacterium]